MFYDLKNELLYPNYFMTNSPTFRSLTKKGIVMKIFYDWKRIFIIVIIFGAAISFFFFFNKDENLEAEDYDSLSMNDDLESLSNETIATKDIESEDVEEEDLVIVDIKGEVKHPGVYEIDSSSRIQDVIKLAGGLKDEADELQINLAAKVYDEMVIFIPKQGDPLEGDPVHFTQVNEEGEKIRVNEATAEELTALSGIGPAKAEAIISYREENGPFKSAEELLNVSGIGEKTLANFEDEIIVP